MSRKILVTGGLGFVGSHLVDALIARGDLVVVVDNAHPEKPRYIPKGVKLFELAIGDDAIESIFAEEKPDAVCHLAAQISVSASVEDPVHDAMQNVVDPLRLLEIARRSGVKKIVFASSGGAIYGDHPELPTPEVFGSHPISPYGISKQAFEHYLDMYHKLHGLEYVALRFSNIFGPRQAVHDKGEGAVIPIFISKLLSGEEAVIFGDGSATRDFLYVKDAVSAFIAALDANYSGAINISTGREVSVKELWDALVRIHGADVPVRFAPERPGDIKRSVLDPSLAKSTIGWEARASFEDALKETYEWFKRAS